ncbi:MAG TPA: alkaline phosphatase family protein [Candidatus Binatia bacterium]
MRLVRRSVVLLLTAVLAVFSASETVVAQTPAKAIVLAWDGTVPSFVRELLREGKLPNLAKLIREGAFADDVKSGFPSKTAPGFASLMTGAPPSITGITGNRVPRVPRADFTILDSLAGFAEAPLQAEPIWSAATRAGKKVVISHMPAFADELSDQSVRFSGYTLTVGRDGIVTKRAIQNEPAAAWAASPASDAPPVEITFSVGEARFFGLLIDDPSDTQAGYDTLLIATARNGGEIKAKLKPAPPSADGERFWSAPITVTIAGNQQARTYFRLFDLKPDGSDFFLYYTRPARDLATPKADVAPSATVKTFIGNGASLLYHQGAFGRTIPNGGSGSAEARYLETVTMAQHQLMETNRWAIEHLPWDLFLAYSPFPDEAEHLWRGYLDSTLSTYNREIAAQLRPFLERAYRTSDEHLGLLLKRRPSNTIFAVISDHGMEGVNKRVALNRVLQESELLTLDMQGKVDLSKTKVLYPAINNGYLLINSTDRKNGIIAPADRSQVVSKTRAVLDSIRDGERRVVSAVHDAASDGLKTGIGGPLGGDLYVDLALGYDFDPRIGSGPLIAETEPYGNHGADPEQASMRTIMVLNGPGIRPGKKIDNVRIIDLAPTLASLLRLPKPRNATGRILNEALELP